MGSVHITYGKCQGELDDGRYQFIHLISSSVSVAMVEGRDVGAICSRVLSS